MAVQIPVNLLDRTPEGWRRITAESAKAYARLDKQRQSSQARAEADLRKMRDANARFRRQEAKEDEKAAMDREKRSKRETEQRERDLSRMRSANARFRAQEAKDDEKSASQAKKISDQKIRDLDRMRSANTKFRQQEARDDARAAKESANASKKLADQKIRDLDRMRKANDRFRRQDARDTARASKDAAMADFAQRRGNLMTQEQREDARFGDAGSVNIGGGGGTGGVGGGRFATQVGAASKGVSKLTEQIKTLNALNIIPFGFERMAYRLSLAASAAPGLVAGLGAVAAAAFAVKKAFDTGIAQGVKDAHPAFLQLERDTQNITRSWEHMGRVMADNSAVQRSAQVWSTFWREAHEAYTGFAEEFSLGAPRLRQMALDMSLAISGLGAVPGAEAVRRGVGKEGRETVEEANRKAEAARLEAERRLNREALSDLDKEIRLRQRLDDLKESDTTTTTGVRSRIRELTEEMDRAVEAASTSEQAEKRRAEIVKEITALKQIESDLDEKGYELRRTQINLDRQYAREKADFNIGNIESEKAVTEELKRQLDITKDSSVLNRDREEAARQAEQLHQQRSAIIQKEVGLAAARTEETMQGRGLSGAEASLSTFKRMRDDQSRSDQERAIAAANVKVAEEHILNIKKKGRELDKEFLNTKEAEKFEDQLDAILKDVDGINNKTKKTIDQQEELRKIAAEQRAIYKDQNKTLHERETALQRLLRVEREFEQILKEQAAVRERMALTERKRAYDEWQARKALGAQRAGLLQPGEVANLRQQLGSQDTRKVRGEFINNRVQDRESELRASGAWDKMSPEARARELRMVRARGQKDWRQGVQQDPGELARAQGEAAIEQSKTLQGQGKITAEQQDLFRQVVENLVQQQTEQERQSQDIQNIKGTLNTLNNNSRRRAQSGVRN